MINVSASLVVADWRTDISLVAINQCCASIRFNEVVFIQNIPVGKDAYCKWLLSELYKRFDSSHCILAQWDGMVIHPRLWTDEFLDYDYIGAPWPINIIESRDPSVRVGCGGFSLRSKRLMKRCSELPYDGRNEDALICQHWRGQLESEGFKFAPVGLAKRWAIEHECHDIGHINPDKSFGFHCTKWFSYLR